MSVFQVLTLEQPKSRLLYSVAAVSNREETPLVFQPQKGWEYAIVLGQAGLLTLEVVESENRDIMGTLTQQGWVLLGRSSHGLALSYTSPRVMVLGRAILAPK